MLFFRDETGKSGCFQTLLQEELVNGLPAFLFGAGPEEHTDGIAALFQITDVFFCVGDIFQGSFLKDVVTFYGGLLHGKV